MTTRLFIDPGLRGCGAALFNSANEKCVLALYVENPVASGRGYEAYVALAREVSQVFSPYIINELHIELPVIYGTVHKKGDPNDTVDCAAVGAAIAAMLTAEQTAGPFKVFHVKPSDWKGQLDKKAMTERIKDKLDPTERHIVSIGKTRMGTPASLMHNVYDAIGIGLDYFGRLNKKVYPGATP